MTDAIDPLHAASDRRRQRRRAEDAARPASPAGGGTNLPVVIEQSPRAGARAEEARAEGFTTFTAHVYGQTGQKRGLRAGPPALEAARSAYLETEYSGPDDRRPPKGLLKKTKV